MKASKEIQDTLVYGAKELKMNYQKNFRRGLEFALIFHVTVISIYLLISYLNRADADDRKIPTFDITVVDIPLDAPPPAEDIKDIPKNDDIVKPQKDLAALDPAPVSKDNAEEMTIKTQDELNNINSQVSHEGDSVHFVSGDNGSNVIKDNNIKDKTDNIIKPPPGDDSYKSFEVEQPPKCVNLEMVRGMMEYPPLAVESGQEGRVTIRVLVGTDGKVIQVGSITGPEVFYDEVKANARNLEFTIGLQNGKPVKVWMTIPFKFKLKN
jgi:TonB family protein